MFKVVLLLIITIKNIQPTIELETNRFLRKEPDQDSLRILSETDLDSLLMTEGFNIQRYGMY